MNKKTVLIIDNFFPINQGETFLESECCFYDENSEVYIYPIWAEKEKSAHRVNIPSNMKVIESGKENKFLLKLMTNITLLFSPVYYSELSELKKTGRFSAQNKKTLTEFMKKGIYISYKLKKELKNINFNQDLVIYSYWMHITSMVALDIRKWIQKKNKTIKIKNICRGHRYDIYEYAQPGEYIPLRRHILKNMDEIYLISDDAKEYICQDYSEYQDKMIVSRLGTIDHGIHENDKKDVFRIVSCSWLRPVKRVHYIANALKYVDFPVEWVHYGDGDEMENIKALVDSINKPNVKIILKGRSDNQTVLKDYKECDYDVFVNVSESEGVPVSIMEAMSFGMPIIATDVGGSREIVVNGKNGYLLPKDTNEQEIAECFKKIYDLNESDYKTMRTTARKIWEDLCDSEKNYTEFIKLLYK